MAVPANRGTVETLRKRQARAQGSIRLIPAWAQGRYQLPGLRPRHHARMMRGGRVSVRVSQQQRDDRRCCNEYHEASQRDQLMSDWHDLCLWWSAFPTSLCRCTRTSTAYAHALPQSTLQLRAPVVKYIFSSALLVVATVKHTDRQTRPAVAADMTGTCCKMHVSHAFHMHEPGADARIWTCDVWWAAHIGAAHICNIVWCICLSNSTYTAACLTRHRRGHTDTTLHVRQTDVTERMGCGHTCTTHPMHFVTTSGGAGWSSRGSKVCVTMLALQCQ